MLARDGHADDGHGFGLQAQHDQLLRVPDETSHGIGEFHDLGVAEVLAKPSLEFVIGFRAPSQQVVGPRQCHLVLLGQITLLMIVGDVVDEFFGETGLTGLIKSNLASKAAVGDSCIAEPHQFLDVDIYDTV